MNDEIGLTLDDVFRIAAQPRSLIDANDLAFALQTKRKTLLRDLDRRMVPVIRVGRSVKIPGPHVLRCYQPSTGEE